MGKSLARQLGLSPKVTRLLTGKRGPKRCWACGQPIPKASAAGKRSAGRRRPAAR